jgi:mannosylglycoprotein endo-beta-mannosidase
MLARASDVALVLLALLLLLPAAHAEQHAAGTFLPSRAAARRLSSGWQACPGTTPLASASRAGYRADPSECFDALVPGTVLRSMIANGSFFPRVRTVDDLYMDDNLKTIPDINSTGKAFFTRVFRVEITEQHLPAETEAADGQLWLHFRGVSYFATVFVDGQAVSPVQSPGATRLAGMFHRWSFDLGSVAALRARRGADSSAPLASVAVLVEPPEFCGRGGADRCGGVKGSCGQGGDHEIAKNAAMMQFTQGWDWAQSVSSVCLVMHHYLISAEQEAISAHSDNAFSMADARS